MNPVESAFNVRKSTDYRSILGENPVTNAVDYTDELSLGVSHEVNVDRRTNVNVLDLPLTIIRDDVPHSTVDESKHGGARPGICSLGDVHVRDVGIKWGYHAAALEVEACPIDPCRQTGALRHQNVQSIHYMNRLTQLCARLGCRVVGLLLMKHSLRFRCLRLAQGCYGLVVVAAGHAYSRVRLIHLIDSHVLLLQKRLKSMQIIGRVTQRGLGSFHCRLGTRCRCLGEVDSPSGGLYCRRGSPNCGVGCGHGTMLRRDFTFCIDDPLFQIFLIGERLLQIIFVVARVNLKQQVSLLYKSIVLDGDPDETATDFWRDLYGVRPHAGIVGPRMQVVIDNDEQQSYERSADRRDEDLASKCSSARVLHFLCHNIVLSEKHEPQYACS